MIEKLNADSTSSNAGKFYVAGTALWLGTWHNRATAARAALDAGLDLSPSVRERLEQVARGEQVKFDNVFYPVNV